MISAMKPKLIIINGSLGIGKSTLTKRYASEHPVTLNLDIDDIWAMLSHWREEKDITAPLSKDMAIEMARISLRNGHDVVVPQILQNSELADRFKQLAADCAADYFEVLLIVDKEAAIRRFIKRGQDQGHPTGFRKGGTIDTGGREKKLAEMYDNMIEVANSRPHVIRLEPVLGDIEKTYSELLEKIN